jgi:hypothetical protein
MSKVDYADPLVKLLQIASNRDENPELFNDLISAIAMKECMDARRPPSESRSLFLALSARDK